VVSDPVTGCQLTAQKKYTVIQSPAFTMAGTNPTACGATDGTISLTAVTSPSLYSYFISGPNGFNKSGIDQSAGTQGPFAGAGAGTFSGIVTDQVSGCTISNTFGLSNNTFTATPTVTKSCDPPVINVTTNATLFPIDYVVTNGSNGQTATGFISALTTNFSVNLPPQGGGVTNNYTIQVKDASGCITTKNFPITTAAPLALAITPPLCLNTVTASGATTYSWSSSVPGSIVGSSTANPVTLTSGIGAVTLTLTGTDAAGCSTTITQNVYISPTIAPAFTQSDPCQNQVVLSATPIGNYTYRWYKAGVLQAGMIGQQIVLPISENGASYAVEVVDALSGCTIKSTAATVQVTGPVTATLTTTLACNDGKPFTLTATTNVVNPTYSWLYNKGPLSGVTTASTQQTNEGIYEVDVTVASCTASSSIQITRAPIPQGLLPSGAVICNDPDNKDPKTSKVDLDPGFFSAYNWFKNNVSLNYTGRVYTADSQGAYRVDLTNAIGCTNSDKIDVTNDCEPVVTGPNAFRPSSATSENKNFHLFTFFITDNFEVVIYNRWGEAVFEAKERNFQWNGGYKNNPNQPLPGGTYVYLVRYVSTFHPDQGVQEQRAGVVLLR
jgi:gliding motility-associated-like protein